jgi:hypothetical protein
MSFTRAVIGAGLFVELVGYQPAYGAPLPQCKKFHVNEGVQST